MVQIETLPNGVRLVTEAMDTVRSAALGFFVGAGSRHELASENGAAHFIEHMSFKGTATRSAGDLAREMDAIGGQVDAYTTKESTCYYARCLDRHLDRAEKRHLHSGGGGPGRWVLHHPVLRNDLPGRQR